MDASAPVLFRERLVPRWPAWLVCGALIAMIAGAYGAALGSVVGWSLGLGLAAVASIATLALSPEIRVTATELRAGPAVLPRTAIGAAVALDAQATRAARGPGADARSYVLLRTLHAATAVRIDLVDPQDPHPSWLLTSARPGELARALSSAPPTDGAR